MRLPTLVVATVITGAQLVASHATVWEVAINGKAQGVGNKQGGYIDTPPNNNPIVDVTSSSMTCNVPNLKASASVTAAGGDTIAFEWHHDSNSAGDDIIASSHHGPILVYISKAGSNSWVKIAEDGWDGKLWAVDKIIAGSYTGKKGQHQCKLPNLAPGDYVLRAEIIALHEGNRQGGAQFYPSCTKVKITGSGSATLPAGVSFPGAYKATDAGILFDIYGSFSSYPIPGPKKWDGASGGSGGNTNPPAQTTLVPSPSPTSGGGNGSGGTVAKYGQCGGMGYSGPTTCASGSTCKAQNEHYSQCI